jgi:hypothetical protein
MAGLPPFAWSTTLRKAEETLAFCQKAAEFLRAVSKLKILDGQFIEVDFAAASTVLARHSLGRAYNGAIVVASNNASGTPVVSAFGAKAAGYLGLDVTRYIELTSTTPFTATLTVWVF